MTPRYLSGIAIAVFAIVITAAPTFTQSPTPTQGPADGGSPAWFLQGSFPDPTGRTIVEPGGRVTVPARAGGPAARGAGGGRGAGVGTSSAPGCSRSPLCGRRGGVPRQSLQRVQWKQTMGYTFEYPYVLPPGFGGVPSVALDSKGNLWGFNVPSAATRSSSSLIRTRSSCSNLAKK